MIALLENAKSLDLSENEKELLYYLENSCKESCINDIITVSKSNVYV